MLIFLNLIALIQRERKIAISIRTPKIIFIKLYELRNLEKIIKLLEKDKGSIVFKRIKIKLKYPLIR